MQTVALARATGGVVTAVDLHTEFLDELRERAESAGLLKSINVMQADMRDLRFGAESFDLIWSEGAAYIMGVRKALTEWRRYLRPAGYVAFSEIVWCSADPPRELHDFFAAEYAGMTDVAGNLARARAAGYEVVGHFTLPESAWWEDYLSPLKAKLPGLFARYAGDEAALAVVESTRQEIDLRRRYADDYAYEFIVVRRPGA
jgi:ubiquinone/menaquinone biosynthesis C-methylase UbiE